MPDRFHGVDSILGPEMKSTGEVMGIDEDFGLACAKAQESSDNKVPLSTGYSQASRTRTSPAYAMVS